MKRNHYQTAGRIALAEFLERHPDRQFTAQELFDELSCAGTVGKSSVYRLLAEMCEDESVRKFQSEERHCAVYQYVGAHCDCRDHFHEKCVRCGKLSHLDCHVSADFIRHLFSEHGFSVDCGQSILYGVCAECQAAGGVTHG